MMDINNITSAVGSMAQVAPQKNDPGIKTDVSVNNQVNARTDSEPQANQEQRGSLQGKQVDKAVAKINDFFQNEQRKLLFSINDSTGDMIVQVKDAVTDEVIRQIPPEYIVKLAEHLNDLNEALDPTGVLFKEQA